MNIFCTMLNDGIYSFVQYNIKNKILSIIRDAIK